MGANLQKAANDAGLSVQQREKFEKVLADQNLSQDQIEKMLASYVTDNMSEGWEVLSQTSGVSTIKSDVSKLASVTTKTLGLTSDSPAQKKPLKDTTNVQAVTTEEGDKAETHTEKKTAKLNTEQIRERVNAWLKDTRETPADAEDLRILLLGVSTTVQAHVAFARQYPRQYVAEILRLMEKGVAISSATRARILAGAWIARLHDVVDILFDTRNFFTIAEVLKAAQLMDAPRRARQLQAKLDKEVAREKPRKGRIGTLRVELNNAQIELHEGSGASGAFARRIRKWMSSISEERLEFFLMHFPTDPWRQLADIIHPSPKDFRLNYFLKVCFGDASAAPADSLVARMGTLQPQDIATALGSNPKLAEYYTVLRTRFNVKELSQEAKTAIVRHAPLEDALWFYEELHCPSAETVMTKRLQNKEDLVAVHGRSNYGKLMERALTFKQMKVKFAPLMVHYCDEKLKEIHVSPAAAKLRAAILSDASASMNVAVRTATIMGSLLSSVFKADLSFFNNRSFPPPCKPTSAKDVIHITSKVNASGCTSPAAGLFPFLQNKTVVDLFVVVTDEEENTSCNGMRFAPMFKKYLDQVNPHARVLFVSFLRANDYGAMRKELENTCKVEATQFRLDGSRPDLSKFDQLLSLIDLEASYVPRE